MLGPSQRQFLSLRPALFNGLYPSATSTSLYPILLSHIHYVLFPPHPSSEMHLLTTALPYPSLLKSKVHKSLSTLRELSLLILFKPGFPLNILFSVYKATGSR